MATVLNELLALSDLELIRRTREAVDELPIADADPLYRLLDEVFERFAPKAELDFWRAIYLPDDGDLRPDEFLDVREAHARRAFRRTYGTTFDELVAHSHVFPG